MNKELIEKILDEIENKCMMNIWIVMLLSCLTSLVIGVIPQIVILVLMITIVHGVKTWFKWGDK